VSVDRNEYRVICPACHGETMKMVYINYRRPWWSIGPQGHATVTCDNCGHFFLEVSDPDIDRQFERAARLMK